jgi:hypothetical protein
VARSLLAGLVVLLYVLPILLLQPEASFGSLFLALTVSFGPLLLLMHVLQTAWLLRFARQVRRFRTAANGRILLHHAPALADKWDIPTLFHRIEEELDRLTQRFSSPLRGRVVVYLFESYSAISKVFGPYYGGTALSLANAIVIADDNDPVRSMRHELAHLVSARWSENAPPLLSEGLSVWWERSEDESSIDGMARVLHDRNPNLSQLLSPMYFFSESHRRSCYVLAGSFCGFLIRRYGWERFEKLYKSCNGFRFEMKFRKCYGMTLEQAESAWRSVTWIPGLLLVAESRTGVVMTRARDFCGQMRSIALFIDGERIDEIPYGCRCEYPLLPGNHSLWVKMDWCRSPCYEVTLLPGDMVELECCIPWRGFWIVFSALTGLLRPGRAFVVRPAPDPKTRWTYQELWEGICVFLGVGTLLVFLMLLLWLVCWAVVE